MNAAGIYSKRNIRVRETLKAVYGPIKAKGSINSGGVMFAAMDIIAGRNIKSDLFVMANSYIIKGERLTTKVPLYNKDFWGGFPPFKRHADKIMGWNDPWSFPKKAFTKEEAQKICSWKGWHPILRWSLEMGFGLKKCINLNIGE